MSARTTVRGALRVIKALLLLGPIRGFAQKRPAVYTLVLGAVGLGIVFLGGPEQEGEPVVVGEIELTAEQLAATEHFAEEIVCRILPEHCGEPVSVMIEPSAQPASLMSGPANVADETGSASRRMLSEQTATIAELERERDALVADISARDAQIDHLSQDVSRMRQALASDGPEQSCDSAVNQAVNEMVIAQEAERANLKIFSLAEWDAYRRDLVGMCPG